jgi:glutamate synthase domain-containing protein 3
MFDANCNLEMIDLEQVVSPEDEAELRGLVERHARYTGSRRAREILENWEASLPHFVKVFPMEYKRALGRMSREDAETEREEVVRD